MGKIDTRKVMLLLFTFINFIIAIASVIFTLSFAYIMFKGGDTLSAFFLVFLSISFGAVGMIALFDYYNYAKKNN